MTKQIIFIFALLCTLQAQASVQPVQKDTVRHTIHYEVAELLQPMQPVYLNGVLLPASRTGNWFRTVPRKGKPGLPVCAGGLALSCSPYRCAG